MKELRELRKELDAAMKAGHSHVVERLFDLLEKQSKRCERLEKENRRLVQRIAELEKQDPPATPSTPSESYSLDAEEKRRRRKQGRRRKQRQTSAKKRKPGRKPNKDKLECVARWVDILPQDAAKKDCQLQSRRPVWHIENGQAVRVGYRVYRLAWQETPRIPGVLPRCEYGIEIHVLLAYLVYVLGVSIDKACQLLQFFCQLPLEPSQADAMLTQLGREWGEEFDVICQRIALAAVVYADETSWRVGRLNTSLWSFTSDSLCVMLFGCSKDRRTLESILPPETFDGVLVSDDAAVYAQGYRGQKCWAHLLRKAVKLVLLHPALREVVRSFVLAPFERECQSPWFDVDASLNQIEQLSAQHGVLYSIVCDDSGRPVSAAIIVEGFGRAFYLGGGTSSALSHRGALSLALWKAMCQVATRSNSRWFDLEGSFLESISSYYRHFGGHATSSFFCIPTDTSPFSRAHT